MHTKVYIKRFKARRVIDSEAFDLLRVT